MSEENISELSAGTLVNYIDSAARNSQKLMKRFKKLDKKDDLSSLGASMDVAGKIVKREEGITRAKNKLIKKASDARRTSVERSFKLPDADRPNTMEGTINEISLDTLSQAARVAMTKRDAARGTPEYGRRDKQVQKFSNAAVKKRREGEEGTGRSVIKPFTKEEYVVEDDMKGMSVKSGHKRPTKAGAGMTKKGVEAYRRRNPGSKLKTAVTTKPSKLKKGSKAANRRKSYCARSAGQMKKFPKAAKDPNSRLRQARRRWNC